MTLKTMLGKCEAAGLRCDRNKVNRLVGCGVLEKPKGGGKGRKNAADYADTTCLRLLATLTLEQPQPQGLDIPSERIHQWMGRGDGSSLPNEFLPAVAYVLGIPGIDVETARKSATLFFKGIIDGMGGTNKDIGNWIETNLPADAPPGAEAFVYIYLGRRIARDPDTFRTSEDTVNSGVDSVSLLNGMGEMMNGFRSPKRLVTARLRPEEAVKEAVRSAVLTVLRTFKEAPPEILGEARFWARLYGRAGTFYEPHAMDLLTWWIYQVNDLQRSPEARKLLHSVDGVMKLVKEANSEEFRDEVKAVRSMAEACFP